MTTPYLRSRHRLQPIGACLLAILLTSRGLGADPPITSITFAPDGSSVLAGSQSGIVQYAWPTLTKLRELPSDVGNLHDLAFSANGQQLGIAGGAPTESGTVLVASWPSFDTQSRFESHEDSVMAICWIDATTLASASLDHQIVIQSIGSEHPSRSLRGHSKGVTSLCLLARERLLVSAGTDQNLRVWDLGSDELVRSMNNHTLPVHALALRPGEHALAMVASVSEDKTVRLWQPAIGRMVRFARLSSVPLDVTWLTDGSQLVVACEDGRIRLIDPDTVEVVQELAAIEGWAYSVAVHPRDRSVLVGGAEGQLKRVSLPELGTSP